MNIHDLKIWPDEYSEVESGRKTADYRRNDRDYKLGDLVLFREFIPDKEAWLLAGKDALEWTEFWWVKLTPKAGKENVPDEELTDDDYEDEQTNHGLTGEELVARIMHVQTGLGVPEGFCVLSLKRVAI
jgi:hypothetical protein